MSSLRNSLHRRNHKERSQLSSRAKLGFLEKHKDYVLRARDYHSKQDRINRLRQKAAERNKDEFYFGMKRQRTKGGVHIQDRGNVALPEDMVKILKTQDENYVRTLRSAGMKKIEKLKAQLTALADLLAPYQLNDEDDDSDIDDNGMSVLKEAGLFNASRTSGKRSSRTSNHLLFAETEEEARQLKKRKLASDAKAAEEDDRTDNIADLGWKESVASRKQKKKETTEQHDVNSSLAENPERREEAKKHRSKLLKELSARMKRDTQLRYAEQELAMQRRLMGKGGSLKLRGVEKVEGGGDKEELNEDELDSMKIKKSVQAQMKKDRVYKPRVYKWRSERKK